jgi:hypothetical protein
MNPACSALTLMNPKFLKMCVYVEYKCDTSLFAYSCCGAFQPDQALPDALAILPSVRNQLARGQTFGIGAAVKICKSRLLCPLSGARPKMCLQKIEM